MLSEPVKQENELSAFELRWWHRCKIDTLPFPKGEHKRNKSLWASSQDGDIGRRGSPPHTTTSKLQLKYRTTITQEHQKPS